MVDEPMAPAPTPQPPPAVRVKRKPPTKQVLMGCGGIAAFMIVVIVAAITISGCGGPDVPGVSPKLDSPDNCAKTYAEFRVKQAWALYEWEMEHAGDDRAFEKGLADFYEDKKEYEKTLEFGEKYLKLYKDKKSELKKYTPPDIKKTEDVKGNKQITIGVKRKYIVFKPEKKEGDKVTEERAWEIKEDTVELTVLCTQIGKEWRIAEPTNDGAIMGMWGMGGRGGD